MSSFTFKHLSLYQTQICKGIAILFIVIHNLLAMLQNTLGHNEFDFDAQRINDAMAIVSADHLEFVRIFMTFLGHYGVQVFIFLSAYGLVRSIDTQPKMWVAFIFKRIRQLIIPMLLVMAFYLILNHYSDGIFSMRTGAHDYWDVVKRLLFISNFYPDEIFLVIGPWWFLSLIMQFYFIFLPLRTMQVRWGNVSLLFISLLGILLTTQYALTATVLGHLPEFALGMYVASLDKIKVPIWLILLATMGLILGNMFYPFWFLAPVCAIIVIMFLCAIIFKYAREDNRILFLLNYIGVLSLYIFLLNGIIREPFVILLLTTKDGPWIQLLFAVLVTLICIILAQGFYILDSIINAKYRKT
ncbi:MAG: acyltransferase [Legionellales bacterium]|jgi:hypothetical protein